MIVSPNWVFGCRNNLNQVLKLGMAYRLIIYYNSSCPIVYSLANFPENREGFNWVFDALIVAMRENLNVHFGLSSFAVQDAS